MSESTSTRGRTDPELDAMSVLIRVLTPLDRAARERVLRWADERFVHEKLMPDFEPGWINRFFDALAEAARTIGDVTPLDIIAAAEEFRRARLEREAAEAAAEVTA